MRYNRPQYKYTGGAFHLLHIWDELTDPRDEILYSGVPNTCMNFS
jgi:hypothetical protein